MRRHRRRSSWWRRHRFRLRRRLREVVIAGLFALALAAFAMWWIPSVGERLSEKIAAPDDPGLTQIKEKEIQRQIDEYQRTRDAGGTTPAPAPRR